MFDRLKTKEVEVQLTPMLDMAFQVLAFFVMTFNPMPLEGQFAMNLLPSTPQVNMEAPSESEEPEEDVPAELRTIRTVLLASPAGLIGRATIGDVEVEDLEQLRTQLKALLQNKDLPFDRAEILADPALKYSELIRVVDIFMSENLSSISFGEADSLGMGGAAL